MTPRVCADVSYEKLAYTFPITLLMNCAVIDEKLAFDSAPFSAPKSRMNCDGRFGLINRISPSIIASFFNISIASLCDPSLSTSFNLSAWLPVKTLPSAHVLWFFASSFLASDMSATNWLYESSETVCRCFFSSSVIALNGLPAVLYFPLWMVLKVIFQSFAKFSMFGGTWTQTPMLPTSADGVETICWHAAATL